MKKAAMILAFAGIFIVSARGQNFTNLNFELAYNLPGNPGNSGTLVSVTNALPDWTAYSGPVAGGDALSQIYYVSNVLGRSQDVESESGSLALNGNDLTVELFGDSSISQTGLLPDNAESLEFEAVGVQSPGFSVSLGGETLSYSAISEGPDYTVYGANIPAGMDGLMEALSFSCLGVGSGQVLLDDIDFSPLPVPEPSEYALMGFGAILFGFRAFSKKRQKRLRLDGVSPHRTV